MSNIKELKEEELEKVNGGDEEPKEESATTNVYSSNLPNSYLVDCPFCDRKRQFIGDKWGKYSSFILPCGCKLVTISMTSVKIIKQQG